MSQEANTDQEELIEVRYSLPKDVHSKIRTRQRQLSAKKDKDFSMEQALIDLIRNPKLK